MDASAIKFADSGTAAAVLNDVNKRKRALKSTGDETDQTNALAVQAKVFQFLGLIYNAFFRLFLVLIKLPIREQLIFLLTWK